MKSNLLTVNLIIAAMFVGCGKSANTVNAFVVYDNEGVSCTQARKITVDESDRKREHEWRYQFAKAKLNWCQAIGGAFLTVGNFDTAAKVYEFNKISVEDRAQLIRFCLDVAVVNGVFDVPPAKLTFDVQTTIVGDVETFSCDEFVHWLWETRWTALLAPAHLPLLIDIDPVLVHATGANPRLEGVPHRYYDEVRSLLEDRLSDTGN